MRDQRALLLLVLGTLACGGNQTDAGVETDRAEPSSVPDDTIRAANWETFEREIKEREHAAGRDSSMVRVTPAADGRLATVALIDTASGPADDPSTLPPDTLPRMSESALVAGIMRWDGIVAPFAAFDGGEWVPVRREAFEQRIARAPLSRWYYIPPRGPKRIVHADTVGDVGCGMYEPWGQATDLDPATLPWRDLFDSEQARYYAGRGCPISRIGLALSEDVPIVRMVESDTDGPEARRVLELIGSVFDEKETDEIDHLQADPSDPTRYWTGHPLAATERARVPIRISALEIFDPQADGIRLSRFLAGRSYPSISRHEQECPVETSLEGFVLGEDRLVFVGPSLSLRGGCSDSPGMQGLSLEPYGLIQLDGHWFLLAMQDGYEWSVPTIHEIDGGGLIEVLLGWEG